MSQEAATAPATETIDFGEEAPQQGAAPASGGKPEKINKGLFGQDDDIFIDPDEEAELKQKQAAEKKKAAKKATEKKAPKSKIEAPVETEETEIETEAEPEETTEEDDETEEETQEDEEAQEEGDEEPKDEKEPEGDEDDNDFEVELELEIDGKRTKEKVSLETLARAYQMKKASDKRFEEASEMVKASRGAQELLLRDPFRVLHHHYAGIYQQQGFDKHVASGKALEHVQLLANRYLAPFIEEANLPEPERRLRQLDREIKERREALEQIKRQEEEAELEARTEAFRQQRRRQIFQAMDELSMPRDEEILRRIDAVMWKYQDRGLQVTPVEAAREILKEREEYLRGYLERADAEELLTLKPDLGTRISQTNLAKVKRRQEARIFGEEPEVPAEPADRPAHRKKKPIYRTWEEAFPGDRR